MKAMLDVKKLNAGAIGARLIPVVFFWLVLAFEIPYSFTQYFHRYELIVFLAVLCLYYLSFRLSGNQSVLTAFGLTMLLCALTLSYLWTSGFSDNFLISGLLPYKDAKNYYLGANLLMNGFPIRVAGQAMGRPLFPGFLSSLLLLTGQNLKVALAILTQLAGIGIYLTARQVRQAMGALSGTLYITFMYFYFQIVAGYTMSESLGFIGGCFGFALIWYAARHRKWFEFLLGVGLLLLAVSARAGAFLIFPMLALWAGWIYRGSKRTSLLIILLLVILAGGFFIINSVYPQLLGVPEDSSFGNFAYTIYGQVRGGIGWHSAIDELSTRNPSRVYQAAWEVFLANPSDFFKGIVRAYGDFFLPGSRGIFVFGAKEQYYGLDLLLWGMTMLIVLRSLYLLIFKRRSDISTLLLAGFIGVFVSIPFLPPIDGGMRFYASTMPFFYVLLGVGVSRSTDLDDEPAPAKSELFFLRIVSVSLLMLTVLLPPVTLRATLNRSELSAPLCTSEQRPFAIRINPGSYIDLVQSENSSCGLAPDICYDDFLAHNSQMHIDDFYQQLDTMASTSRIDMRIIPTINLLDGNFQYFVTTDGQVLAGSSHELLSGCAARIQTENQRIFWIESISELED